MRNLWRNKIVDIYIIKEVLLPYIAGVAIVTVIGLSNLLFELTEFIIKQQVPIPLVVELLLYKLPDIIVQTFPIAILFATIYSMSRLNRENEFTAFRLGGISLYRIMLPLIFMGIVISGVTYFINEQVVPWSNHEFQNIIRINILKQKKPDVEDNVFFKGPEGRLFYVGGFNQLENTLEKIVVYQLPDGQKYPEIITAQSGVIMGIGEEEGGEEGSKWRLNSGIIHRYSEEGKPHQTIMFDTMEYEIVNQASLNNFFGEQRTTAEMSREQLGKNIRLFQRSGIEVTPLLVDYHLKLSMPLTALIFILIGTPLSLSSKDSPAASYIFTVIIVFLYYLILSLSRSFGKNGSLPPLFAAWLPNIFFGVIGIMLLAWREKWQSFTSRIPFLGVIFFLLFMLSPMGTAQAESLSVSNAEQLSYNQEHGKFELTGDIAGQYSHFHILADKVTIKMKDGTEEVHSEIDELNMEQGKFTGCDLESPHYYFDAREVIIYPEDYLIAKHVTFRELNGRLPLFYWPYLYISLKDRDQRLVPEIGYSSSRGWFLKTTYHYLYDDRLPGELYMDYYTKSGFAGGFKQFFFHEEDLEAFIYLYGQENKTDIPNLFNWEGEIKIDNDKNQWKTDAYLKYINYDQYDKLDGKIRLDNNADTWSLKIDSSFSNKDYYDSDKNDDENIGFNLTYDKDFIYNWKYYLNFYRYYSYNKDDGLKQRWGGLTYLSRDIGQLDYRLTFERRAPSYTEEDDEKDKITYYRLPELELNYTPRGLMDYKIQLGNYYENNSNITAYRLHGNANLNKTWRFFDRISFTTDHDLIGRVYNIRDDDTTYNYNSPDSRFVYDLPYQLSYNNVNTAKISLFQGLNWTNRYTFSDYVGQSVFSFDNARKTERINTGLNYTRGGWNSSLSTAYDIHNGSYSPITIRSSWRIQDGWNLNMGTSYNIENETFADLYITNKYNDDNWQINNGLRYDLNNNLLKRVDNQIVYEYNDEWHFALNTIYDNQDKRFETANLKLKKLFHCRSLTFSYNYLKQEYTLEYNINLFPDQKFMVGSSEEDSFMFDVGIDDLISSEN
ncbi:MAG: LptF/LptG family permease [Halanaerobiales bacterium]